MTETLVGIAAAAGFIVGWMVRTNDVRYLRGELEYYKSERKWWVDAAHEGLRIAEQHRNNLERVLGLTASSADSSEPQPPESSKE